MFQEATTQAQLPQTQDFNGASNEGFGKYHLTIKDGKRWSSFVGYLKPNLERKNLKIIAKKTVSKIIIENKRAIGVKYCDAVSYTHLDVYKRQV